MSSKSLREVFPSAITAPGPRSGASSSSSVSPYSCPLLRYLSPSFSTFPSSILSSLCHLGQGFEILSHIYTGFYKQAFQSFSGGAVWGHTFVGDTVEPTTASNKCDKLPSKQTSLENLLPVLRGQPCSTVLQKHPLWVCGRMASQPYVI